MLAKICLVSRRALLSRLVALAALTVAVRMASAEPASPPPAPLQIDAPEQKRIDLTRTDGGLVPVARAENYGVFRASLAEPELAEQKGYTYNHHPDLAVWHGRFYIAWDSGQKDEDTWPARELYSTSENGRDWSASSELFPEGLTTPMRLYFFHAPNGRMLAFAGLRIDHAKTDEDTKGPLVVREIQPDHALGAIFTLRPPTGGARQSDPALFTTAQDAGFRAACQQLLAARVTLETQDLGVLLDPPQRLSWHNAAAWPNGKLGNGFWKAPSFYHRKDGAIVGIGKAGWTSISTDEGATWSMPVVPATLTTNNAKVWGQRTGDGRYALVYNPTPRPRYPLAIVSGDDGVVFRDMRAVQSRFPAQRYPGINKNTGLQYVRGIAEWASDGSIPDAQRALWLVYSANKEDIWVSRVVLPGTNAAALKSWNIYQPKWAKVTASDAATLAFETREPFDCAEATQLFAPAQTAVASFKLTTPPRGLGAIDVDVMGGAGGARPVRLRFTGDGFLRAIDRDKMVEFGRYAPSSTVALQIEARCGPRGLFTVSVDGKKIGEAQFAEATSALERIVIRVWARADADRAPVFLPATAIVGPEFDAPAVPVASRVSDFAIETR